MMASPTGFADSSAASRVLPDWLRAHADALETETSMEYLARHSHSFRYAARFLPPPLDTQVADVYAFCRFTDDLVDGSDLPVPELRARLRDWERLARQAYDGTPSGFTLLDRPLLDMGRRGIPFAYAADLIAGVGMDLEPRRFATLAELDVYSYRVASVVGLWLTRLVGVDDARVLARAVDLGHAMQLTNILRDVGEDFAAGRLYLPCEVLERHGIREDHIAASLADGTLPQGWSAAMEELMAAAEARYRRALQAIPALPAFFRIPVAVSALVYRDIHTGIRRRGYDNLRLRARTSSARKVWLGLKARLLVVAGAAARESPGSRGARALQDDGLPGAPEVPGPWKNLRDKGLRIVLPLLLLLLFLLAGAAGAAGSADASSRAPAKLRPNAEAQARRELAQIEAELRGQPGNLDLQLQRLRILHPLSVQDAALLPVSRAAREQAEKIALAGAGSRRGSAPLNLLLAYQGALDVVEARHAFWPRARLEPLKRGLPRLDTAVQRAPDDAEIRYLRLTSSYYLPFFLGRKWSVREDFKALALLLPAARASYPAAWYVALTDFVLEHGDLAERDRARLRRARSEALESRGFSEVETAPPDLAGIR